MHFHGLQQVTYRISSNFRGPKISQISQNLGTNHINFFLFMYKL